jgi:hypothetical protein
MHMLINAYIIGHFFTRRSAAALMNVYNGERKGAHDW